jgi:Zn-dependent protease
MPQPLSVEWLKMLPLVAPVLLLSLTLHEFAHARVALLFGDPTALHAGRVTLNPLKHLDPVGTFMLFFSGMIGWAKPVPVNPYNLHPRRLGDIMVSVAGPLSNLALAVLFALALRICLQIPDAAEHRILATLKTMLLLGILANLGLCLFNLIPLFPLDGHHIVRELLPSGKQNDFMYWQTRFGVVLLIALIALPAFLPIPSPIGMVLYPVVDWILGVLLPN